jgi:hypothetical protein
MNYCSHRDVEGEKVYDFVIAYEVDDTPYTHDDNCIE